LIQEFLKSVALFREIDDDDLAHILMVGLVKRYKRGAVILTEGSSGGQLHVVYSGQVRISKKIPGLGEEALTVLRSGDFFGEIEFLDGSPSSASAQAHSDCEIFSLPHAEIRAMMRHRPELSAKFLLAFCHTLAGRLRETNQRVASLLALARQI
jgi:CRP/FNR family cyclic AMP-dependent transcriptional regulator